MLSYSECCVCVCMLCLLAPFLSTFVFHGKIEANQHECDFYKWEVFEKQKRFGTVNFWYQGIIHSM